MTIRYVGMGGSNANDGLSWATRKLTLNGVEDSPVQAGDTVYVGAGTYREQLTVDVSGSSGSPITYIGDYDGSHTDGVGGVVRITGSTDDTDVQNIKGVYASGKNHRTFKGFSFDGSTRTFELSGITFFTIENCAIIRSGNRGIYILDTSTNITIRNCFIIGGTYYPIAMESASAVNNANIVIENCILFNGHHNNAYSVQIIRYGGVVIKNTLFIGGQIAVRVSTVPSAGQIITINNCIMTSMNLALYSVSSGYLVEDYNNFIGNETDRVNVDVGAHSTSQPFLLDTRWFHEMVNGGDLVTPFDMPSYSKLINVAGISPSATDMRGTGAIGGVREWGALEYDPDLKIKAGGDTPPSAKPKTSGQVRRIN